MQMTKKTATTFMRWVIVLALFYVVIYQSNQIEQLQKQYTALVKTCQK
jgi:hypothetical protein